MFRSDSFLSKTSTDSKKKSKAAAAASKRVVNDDELGLDDLQIEEVEKEAGKVVENVNTKEEEEEVFVGMRLDSSDLSIQLLKQLRNEFMRKYSKNKYLLVFDKSSPSTEVSYFMISPHDNSTLFSKAFKFNIQPLRDLIYYRAVCVDNKVYFIGGISTKGKVLSPQTFVYDVRRNTWKECARLNTPRCKFSVAVVKNKIYIMGGQDIYGTALFQVERYDPRHDTWEEVGLLSAPVKFHSSCVIKNRYIIVSGGCKTPEDNFNIYDTDEDEIKSPIGTFTLPLERENHAMIAYKNNAYLIGGLRYEARANDPDNPEPLNEDSINSIDLNSVRSLNNNVWKTLSHPRTYENRNGCAACVLNDYIYIIGGHTVENNDNPKAVETKLVERFHPATNRIEKAFMLEPDIKVFDVDCCLVDVDINENENFSIDAVFFNNTPLW